MATKINWFSIIAIGAVLIKGLSEALEDGKITVDEIIKIVIDVITKLGLQTKLDMNGISYVTNFLRDAWLVVEDGKITADEIKDLMTSLSEAFSVKLEQ